MKTHLTARSMPAWRHYLWGIVVNLALVSCQRPESTAGRDRNPEDLFAAQRDALVAVLVDIERYEDWRPSGMLSGFFVSPEGLVLTATHHLPTTRSVMLAVAPESRSAFSIAATVVKIDKRLDLALLKPTRPISPMKHFTLELDRTPTPGQSVAILNVTVRGERTRDESNYVTRMLAVTVTSQLRRGLFATDGYSYPGISGAPVVDLTSRRVVGVSIQRHPEYEWLESRTIPYPLRNGTRISLRVPFMVAEYGIARSLSSAREFFEDLPEFSPKQPPAK